MKSALFLLVNLISISGSAWCGVIYESASLVSPGFYPYGIGVASNSYLGTSFRLSQQTYVTAVGGYVTASDAPSNGMFAAIVPLNSPDALPSNISGIPFATSPLITRTFTAPFEGADVVIPMPITLHPGSYALVFGAGAYGATSAGGWMQHENDGVTGLFGKPGTNLLQWYDRVTFGSNIENSTWISLDNTQWNVRFFVEGTAVPEPAAFVLVTSAGIAAAGLAAFQRARRGALEHNAAAGHQRSGRHGAR